MGLLFSVGRALYGPILALGPIDRERPESELLQLAARIRLRGNPEGDLADAIRRVPRIDPLWPALSRHIARQSTTEDRALLLDLAQPPERRVPPLSDALQFYVRGDIMFEDGTIVTLDELCDQQGLPHLPYLD